MGRVRGQVVCFDRVGSDVIQTWLGGAADGAGCDVGAGDAGVRRHRLRQPVLREQL